MHPIILSLYLTIVFAAIVLLGFFVYAKWASFRLYRELLSWSGGLTKDELAERTRVPRRSVELFIASALKWNHVEVRGSVYGNASSGGKVLVYVLTELGRRSAKAVL